MAAFVFFAAAAGALLVAAYLVTGVLNDVPFLVAKRAGAGRGMFGVPIGSNHFSPFAGWGPTIGDGARIMLNINRRKVKDRGVIRNADRHLSENPAPKICSAAARTSMDGKGRHTDPDHNRVERLWRTVKYEQSYLKGYSKGRGLRLA